MDEPDGTEPPPPPKPRRAKRTILQCPQCDDVFVDQESFDRHVRTHVEEEPPAEVVIAPGEHEQTWERIVALTHQEVDQEAQAVAAATPPPPRLHFEDFAEWVVLGVLRIIKIFVVLALLVVLPAVGVVAYLEPHLLSDLWNSHMHPPPLPTHRPAPPTRAATAQAAVKAYLQALHDGAYVEAYAQLSPVWKKRATFEQFVAAHEHQKVQSFAFVGDREPTRRRSELDVEVDVIEGGAETHRQITYVVVEHDHNWTLQSSSIRTD